MKERSSINLSGRGARRDSWQQYSAGVSCVQSRGSWSRYNFSYTGTLLQNGMATGFRRSHCVCNSIDTLTPCLARRAAALRRHQFILHVNCQP